MDAGREIVALWRAVGTLQRQAAKLPSRVPVGGGGEVQDRGDLFLKLNTSDGEGLAIHGSEDAAARPPHIGHVVDVTMSGDSAGIYGIQCWDYRAAEEPTMIWRRILTVSYTPDDDEPALDVNTFEVQISEDDGTIYMRVRPSGDPEVVLESKRQIWPPLWQTYSEAPE